MTSEDWLILDLEVIRGLLAQLILTQTEGGHAITPGGAALFSPQEIRARAEALMGMRQIEHGEYVTRRDLVGAKEAGS